MSCKGSRRASSTKEKLASPPRYSSKTLRIPLRLTGTIEFRAVICTTNTCSPWTAVSCIAHIVSPSYGNVVSLFRTTTFVLGSRFKYRCFTIAGGPLVILLDAHFCTGILVYQAILFEVAYQGRTLQVNDAQLSKQWLVVNKAPLLGLWCNCSVLCKPYAISSGH
jgi:hypothetical protein